MSKVKWSKGDNKTNITLVDLKLRSRPCSVKNEWEHFNKNCAM